jgi:hypothetical protein
VDKASSWTLLCKKAVTSHHEPFAPQNAFSIRNAAPAETLVASRTKTIINSNLNAIAGMRGVFINVSSCLTYYKILDFVAYHLATMRDWAGRKRMSSTILKENWRTISFEQMRQQRLQSLQAIRLTFFPWC